MSSFDDREKQFEAKFKHDQEIQFKVSARRDRLLGEWAGALMGLEGDALAQYAKDVVTSDLKEPGDEDVFMKVKSDLSNKGVEVSDHQIRRHMTDLLMEAKKQVMAE